MSIWHALPPELFVPIISALHADVPSSRNCALVCTAWVAPSRRNIFYMVRLVLRFGHCESLLALLEHTPAIASYIREVRLVVRDMDREWDSPALRTLLVCLDKLTSVKFALPRAPRRLLEEHPSLERITALCLGGIFFPSTITFRRFVAAFPSLLELSVSRLLCQWWGNSGDETPHVDAPPLRILRIKPGSISAASVLTHAVISWLVEQRSPVLLQELVLSLHTELHELSALKELLRKGGGSLRSLVLYGGTSWAPAERIDLLDHVLLLLTDIQGGYLNLEHCTSLVSLRIASDQLGPLIDTLSTIQSAHMRSLELDVFDAVVEHTLEWDKLAAVLNQPLFGRLNSLIVWAPDAQTDGPLSPFALLQQRGIVRWNPWTSK